MFDYENGGYYIKYKYRTIEGYFIVKSLRFDNELDFVNCLKSLMTDLNVVKIIKAYQIQNFVDWSNL